jgi:hypothetical protein
MRFHRRIFTYAKILIGIVRRNAVGEDVYDGEYLLVSTKSHESGRIPLTLEIARIVLACINDLVVQRSTHSAPTVKEMRRV